MRFSPPVIATDATAKTLRYVADWHSKQAVIAGGKQDIESKRDKARHIYLENFIRGVADDRYLAELEMV